jgi:hypothetical protein
MNMVTSMVDLVDQNHSHDNVNNSFQWQDYQTTNSFDLNEAMPFNLFVAMSCDDHLLDSSLIF